MQCKKTLKLESQPPGNDQVLNVPDINEVQRVYTRPDNYLPRVFTVQLEVKPK